MSKDILSFKDLQFYRHPTTNFNGKQTRKYFNNGYGISVIKQDSFDYYECAITDHNDHLISENKILKKVFGRTDDFVISYLNEHEVSEIMKKIQLLKKEYNHASN